MKRITLPQAFTDALEEGPVDGRVLAVFVEVNWFPPRTMEQHLENALARERGEAEPHPDPNLIEIVCPYPATPRPRAADVAATPESAR